MGKNRPETNQLRSRPRRSKRPTLHLPVRPKRSTRPKITRKSIRSGYVIDKAWVSASALRNYLLKDPLQDWLNEYGNPLESPHSRSTTSRSAPVVSGQVNLTDFLKNQGNEFEKQLIPQLFQKFGPDVIIDIGGNHQHCTITKFEETCEALRQGVPIIYSGVLHDPETKIYGVPDLIVRSDWLSKLVNKGPLDSEEAAQKAPKLSGPYHYRIVDIKFATLYLRADGIHLLNQESIPAYKGQLWVYNQILATIQGYDPEVAYLLGRRWKYSTRGNDYKGNNCLDRLGVVDFRQVDHEYIQKSQDAIDWLRDVRTDGSTWNVTQEPLTRWELYPNMSNRSDHPWRTVKDTLAKQIGEITLLWQCGPKNRKIAHSNGILRWDDPDCTPETVGMAGDQKCRVLAQILQVNQQENPKSVVQPKFIQNNMRNWQVRKVLEFFVDFENVSDIIDTFRNLPEANALSMIFMIGVGYIDPETQRWAFQNFTVDQLTHNEEGRICRQFSQFIQRMCQKYEVDDVLLVHWSRAEVNMWEAAAERHPKDNHWVKTSSHWFDLYKVFESEPIVVHGCLSFGLKDVAKAFHSHGLIKTTWDTTSACQNGASAMVIADQANREAQSRKISMTELPMITEMARYNEVDCKVMSEIMAYLRENHVKAEPLATRVKRRRKT